MSDTPLNIKPAFQSTKPDGPDATKIQPSAFNAGQVVSGGTDGQLLVVDNAQTSHVSGTTSPHVVGLVHSFQAPSVPQANQSWWVDNGATMEEYMLHNGVTTRIRTVTP